MSHILVLINVDKFNFIYLTPLTEKVIKNVKN